MTGKRPVWSEYTFPAFATVENTRWVYVLMVYIVIVTCVDLVFFLAWFKCTCTVATELGKYLLTSFDVNPGHDWNIHCLLPLSMLMEQGLNLHHVVTVLVLGVMKFDVHYYFILFVSALVITLVVQRVVFYIIHCFYIVFPGWLFCPCIWFSLLVIWT